MKTTLFCLLSLPFLAIADPLPLPEPAMPENPVLPPLVITAGGQKLMLDQTNAAVRWNASSKQLETNKAGWWFVNYPIERIQHLTSSEAPQVMQELLGQPSSKVKNWYLRSPGSPAPEPQAPSGPAVVRPNPKPDFVVDVNHPKAADANPGTFDAPFKTLAAAIQLATPGKVIQVRSGIYRESMIASVAGTADAPITIEGIRGSDGQLPVITGNDPAPEGAWKPVAGQPNLWRAENWTGVPANLALNGKLLRERTLASELAPGEYSQNYAAPELSFPQLKLPPKPAANQQALGKSWQVREVDEKGSLDLGEKRGVFYLTSWVWLPPGEKRKTVWDPRFPEPVTGNVQLNGGFRAGRTSSLPFGSQLNLYRLWINGEWMPAAGRSAEARAHTDYGRDGDQWLRLPFKEGWNHLLILADSRANLDVPNKLRFGLPQGRAETVSTAIMPPDLQVPITGRKAKFVTQWNVLGPLNLAESKIDRAVYFRTPPGVNPNKLALDLGKRKDLVKLDKPFWTMRGFEVRHGTQYQQHAAVTLSAPGVVFEHNLIREPEVRGISLGISAYNFSDTPMLVRGNWVVSPGAIGMGASGNTKLLTPENLSNPPGRGRVIIDFNCVIDNNRSGYARFWESGAMKFFRMTGCVIRHNTIVDGDGPGIWLDWEHYNNRIEANLGIRPVAFLIGVEASAGPHLLANNVAIDTKPGGEWFRYALLAWSSARIWAVSNTLIGGDGMQFVEGPDDRKTAWGAIAERNAAAVNNLIVAKNVTLHRGKLGFLEGNLLYGPEPSGLHRYSKWGDPAAGAEFESSSQMGGTGPLPKFANPEIGNFRVPQESRAANAGVPTAEIIASGKAINLPALVEHDFYGLLRFSEDPVPAGAFRVEYPPQNTLKPQIEVELIDGNAKRLWTPLKPKTVRPL